MDNICEVNYYTYANFYYTSTDDRYICEVEMINKITGAATWKMYKARDKKQVIRTARGQATKFKNQMKRIYES